MDESRKNPYRRVRPSRPEAEKRPGLRQLPKDFDDLATGRTDRLPHPRRTQSPLNDEREGAVIPGVRNTEARAVYDARVVRLRAQLAQGREAELREGLEEVRSLTLWRARNVTDYRAFAESVVGVTPQLAEELCAVEAPAALPEHAIALAIRAEAALLARSPGSQVRLYRDEGGLRMAMDISASDVPRAVEAISDAGKTADGLRRFLRGEEFGGPPPNKRRW
jgi:hypothetical protein